MESSELYREVTEMTEESKAKKKREMKPGTRRVTVVLTEAEYKYLADMAVEQMREPNNLLSFALRGQMADLLTRD